MDLESVRPWGRYEVVVDAPTYKAKVITVEPGKRLSYQRHSRRAEHWFVVQGSGRVVIDDAELLVHAGGAVDVPRGAAHRMENPGVETLVFVEVQTGDYFGEDDIVRLDDDYGRVD